MKNRMIHREKHERSYEKKSDFTANFLRCGLAGWCLEVLFTSVHSLFAGDFSMTAHTSFLMFPIYGMGAVLAPIGEWVDKWIDEPFRRMAVWRENEYIRVKFLRHGLLFMVLIFIGEYVSGSILRRFGVCPWDYTGKPANVDGLIRLDFAPFWFVTGLLLEKITQKAPVNPL